MASDRKALFNRVRVACRRRPETGREALRSRGKRAAAPFKRTLLAETLEQRILMDADPLAVATVHGSISSPGEVDNYSFTLDNATKISFDSLSSNGNFRWSLAGPSGTLYSDQTMVAQGSSAAYAPLALVPGDYKLSIDAVADNTGDYGFRLLDHSRAPTFTLNSTVSGKIGAVAQAEVYTFDASAGDRLFLSFGTRPGDATLRIYDPFGNAVGSGYGGNNEIAALPYNGRYSLVLDSSSAAKDADYAFTLHKIVAPVTDLPALATAVDIGGTIAAPGDSAVYRFTLGADTAVIFDAITGSDSFTMSLTGPAGTVTTANNDPLSGVGLDSLDNYYSSRGLLPLIAGDYTLTIDGGSNTTGAYLVRMVNASSPTSVAKDTVVNGVLDPGASLQVYRIAASAGDGIKFDALSPVGAGHIDWTLYDPFGRRVTYAGSFSDSANLTLACSGDYTLVVTGALNRTEASNYSFKLVDNGNTPPTPLPVGTALPIGTAIQTGSLAAGGSSQVWRFTLDEPTTLYFDPTSAHDYTTYANMAVRLDGPRGNEMTGRRFGGYYDSYSYDGAQLWSLLPAGDYALTVSSSSVEVPNYQFRVIDLAASAAALPTGTPVNGQLNPGSGVSVYKFTGSAGERIYLDLLEGNWSNLRTRLIDPWGREGATQYNAADTEIVLPCAGTYVWLVEGNNNHPGPVDYRLQLNRPVDHQLSYDPAATTLTPLQWGQDGAAAALQFDGSQYASIASDPALDLIDDLSVQVRFKVDNLDRQWQSILYKGNHVQDGNQRNYSLWVNSAGYVHLSLADQWGQQVLQTLNGSIQAGVWYDLTAVVDRSTGKLQIYLNGTQAAEATDLRTTAAGSHNRTYDSALTLGNALEAWSNDESSLEGAISELRLWSRALGAADVAALLTGTPDPATDPTLALWLAFDEGTGSQLADKTAGQRNAAVRNVYEGIPGVVVGKIATPGQQAVYHFTLAQAQRIYFDALTLDPAFNVELTGPNTKFGGTQDLRTVDYSYNTFELPAGDYTITIDADGQATGIFAFRLLDAAQAMPIAFDATISGAVSPGDSANLYRFDATAGQVLYFDNLSYGGTGTAYWRLVDPFGAVVFGRRSGDVDNITLATSGSFTLIVDGYYADHDRERSASYSFVVREVTPTPPQAITIGTSLDAGVQRAPGRNGGGAVPINDPQYITIEGAAVDIAGSSTIEAWFKAERFSASGSWTPLFVKSNGAAQRQYGLWLNNNGSISAEASDHHDYGSSIQSAAGLVAAGAWNHVALVLDRANSRMSIVLNGTEVATGYLYPEASLLLPDPLRLGRNAEGYADQEGYDVSLDELRIWDSARSVAAIAGGMNAALTGSEAGLAALYRFDEGSSSALVDATGRGSAEIIRLAERVDGLVVGRIDAIGQSRSYTFTLDSERRLYLDNFSRRSDLYWRLTGPTVDLGNALYYADSSNSYNLLILPAGNYTFTVDGQNTATGDFAFRFIDTSGAQAISLDSQVDTRLDPGAMARVFTFDATAGTRVFMDALTYDGYQPAWRLLDPAGAVVRSVTWMADVDVTPLARGGRYTLIVEDYTSSSGRSAERNVSFNIRSVTDQSVVLTPGANVVNGPLWGNGPVAGEPAVKLDGTAQIVVGPTSALELTGNFTIEVMVKVDRYGTGWTPLISRAADFAHQTFGLWLGTSGQINLDSNYNGNFWNLGTAANVLTPGGWHRVSATLDRTSGAAAIYVDGSVVASSTLQPYQRPAAASVADAALHIGGSDLTDSRSPLLGSVADVRVWNVARSAEQIAAASSANLAGNESGLVLNLQLGEGTGSSLADSSVNALGGGHIATVETLLGPTLVQGRIASPGQRVLYSITPGTDTTLLFDALTNDGNLSWSLLRPSGNAVTTSTNVTLSGRSFQGTDGYSPIGFFTLAAGTSYTLVIDGDGSFTGDFAFRLLDRAQSTALAYDTPTTLQTGFANSTALYQFTGTAGDQLVLDRLNYTDTRPYWQLYDASGVQLYNNDFYYDSGTLTLQRSGSYTLAISGLYYAQGTGRQEFQVSKTGTTTVPGLPDGSPLVFTDGVAAFSGATTVVGEAVVGRFTLAQPTHIYVDTLNSSYPQYYQLWSIDGAQPVAERRLHDTDGPNRLSFYALPAGDYAFKVRADNASYLGNFAFRLVDIDTAAQALGFDVAQTGTLTPAAAASFYEFSATAGERLFFQYTSQTGMGSAYWRVLDARTLEVVAQNYFTSHLDGVNIPTSGNYLLSLEGHYGDAAATASYSFTAFRSTTTATTITLGTPVNAELSRPGDTRRFGFTLADGQRMLFDSLTNRGDISWSILDADGVEIVSSRGFSSDYASGTAAAPFQLKAGSYTLVVDGSVAATGQFAFRLLGFASAAAINPGTAVNGQLTPGNSARLYQFDANAGDSFYYDQLTFTGGGSIYWRLYDPYGQRVLYNGFSDVDVFALNYTGSYTLVVEGYVGNTADTAFSFNVVPVLPLPPVQLSIGSQPAPNLVAQNLVLSGDDGSIHSGGKLNVSWTTANVGNLDVAAGFHERVLVINSLGQTVVNQLLAYDQASGGNIVAGGSRARSTQVQLPAGAAGAGTLTVRVVTDAGNAILEKGLAGEEDNSTETTVESTLLLYPDLTVTNLAVSPSTGLAAGDQLTIGWRDQNSGDMAPGSGWSDRIVVRNRTSGQVLIDQTVAVSAADGAITPGGGLNRQFVFNWPAGAVGTGEFEVVVTVDGSTEVAEYNASNSGETNNSASTVFTSAPDLRIESLQVVTATPTAGGNVLLSWTVRNDGNAPTPAGWYDRIVVRNMDTSQQLLNLDVFYTPAAPIAAGGTATRSFTVRLPEGMQSVGNVRFTVTADQNASGSSTINESNEGNNGAEVTAAVILKPYADLSAHDFTSPAVHRSGDAADFSFTVTNLGGVATDATSWYDRVILSRDAIIGNGDDITIANILHSGSLAAGASYTVERSAPVPGGYDGTYYFAAVSDVFASVTEPDTRANNTSAINAADLTPYHPDLIPALLTVPTAAISGQTMTVSWRITNTGDAASASGWYDQLWLSPDGTVGQGAGEISLGVFYRGGALPAGNDFVQAAVVNVPDGLTGTYKLVLRADTHNWVNESRFEGNNTVASDGLVTITAAPAVDLVVGSITAPAQVQPGQSRLVQWQITNTGLGTAAQPWSDHVYLSKDGTTSGAYYLGAAQRSQNLAGGASYTGSLQVTLPDAADGTWRFLVITDAANQVYESGAATAEAQNTGLSSPTTVTHADLTLSNITVSALSGGQMGSVGWTITNVGSGPTDGAWVDRVYLSSDNVLGAGDVLLGSHTSPGSLAAGASASFSLDVTPPVSAVGSYHVFVVSDATNLVREVGGEANNMASAATSIAAAPLPNLSIGDITSASSALPGRTVPVSWTVHNTGNLAASGNWAEQVYLSADGAIGGDQLLATFYYNGNELAAGASVTRTESLAVPAFAAAGNYRFVVRVDTGNTVAEHDELDNAAIAAAGTAISAALSLTLASTQVGEHTGASAIGATLTRSGATDSALTVNLAAGAGLAAPATVVIPVGQSSVNFSAGVIDNAIVEGKRSSSISASAAGLAGASASILIVDNDVAQLNFSAAVTTISEAHGPLTVTVTRNTADTNTPVTVLLSNNKPYKMTVPDSVTIAAGAASASFQVAPVNDTAVEGDRTIDIGGAAGGFAGAGLRLIVTDDDIPSLSLDLVQSVVSEAGGIAATRGIVTRSVVSNSAVTVGFSGGAGRIRLPSYVTFLPGQASVEFDINVVQNDVADGDHEVTVNTFAVDDLTGSPLRNTQVGKSLLITDDDGPTISLSLNKSVVGEAPGFNAATLTVTRNTPTTDALTVHLSSSDTSEAVLPASVTIPIGQASATVQLTAIQDNTQDGSQNLTIVASAAGFSSGSAGLMVTDRDLADLQVASVTAPATAVAGTSLDLGWTVANPGLGAASGAWVDAVYLSSDNVLSPDDQSLGTWDGMAPLANGASYTRTISVGLGTRVGTMWAFVVTDRANTVVELSDGNNVSATQIDITPSYYATVQTDVVQAFEGTPIEMTGSVFDSISNEAKPFQLVTVKVVHGNVTRSIDALADKNGNFKARFTPLPGEAGHYAIQAIYPGAAMGAAQDSFDVLGMKATGSIDAALLPGQTITGTLEVKNLSPVALTNVRASVASLPPTVSLVLGDPQVLAGEGTILIPYTVTAAADSPAVGGAAPISITSDEGVSASAQLKLSVTPLAPRLVANPGVLTSGMLRGAQTPISFEVVNTGGAATGALTVQLPSGTPWLSLASDVQIASLAPGERTTITLLLSPDDSVPLQPFSGSLNVVGTNTFASVGFQFRAVSEAKGDVQITVTDEYTYFADGSPKLAGATVQLLDAFNYAVVATAITDATGVVSFSGINEGTYTVQVSAAKHDTYRAIVKVTPGGLAEDEAFLHRQAVTYNWTVVPTEVEDRYRIVLESTFETEVPMPVVTLDDPVIMPLVFAGYKTQFDLTYRNHGLIEARDLTIQVPQDSDYIITPLVSYIPVLAAKSEITIPCTIELRPDSPLARLGASDFTASGPGSTFIKCLGLNTVYTYECKNGVWVSVPKQIAPTVGCLESFKDAAKSIPEYLAEKSTGNLLGAGCDVISLVNDCVEAAGGDALSDCWIALITTICKAGAGAATGAVAGGVGAIPGAIGGALSNWSDILACLCSLNWGIGGSGGGTNSGGGGGGWGWGGVYGGPGSPYTTPIGYTIPQNCSGSIASVSTGESSNAIVPLSNGVCAEVRLRVEQEAVITRTGFLGTLEVNNGRADVTLEKLELVLDIRDAQGNAANDKFVVRGPLASGLVDNGDGTYRLDPSSLGSLQFTFIPTNDAAPDAPVVYSMGGTLRYLDNGVQVDVPLLPAKITVYPEAKLNLDYFWQRDVYGDDPFTDEIEASLPFALGLQVANIGKGGAGNLTIASAQPEIIENEKGLLIDFKIIGSQVGNQPTTPSLTVKFGNIAPGETKTAQWNLISSLQGKFKDFSATFEHLDDKGDLRTSLINQVNIHELTRQVYVTTPTSDGIPDYLVNDVPDPDNLPDMLYLSTGSQAGVTVASDGVFNGGGLVRTLVATMEDDGWSYLKIADVLPGYDLKSVVRSDGKVIPVDGMVWRTNRSYRQDSPGAIRENLVHLLDYDGAGLSYTFTFRVVDHLAPTIQTLGGPVAGVQTAAVDAIDLTFSELINEPTLDAGDFKLYRDGVLQTLPTPSFTYVSGNTWRVSGLAAATGTDGNYRLVFDARGIQDLGDNAGTNDASIEWAMGAGAPVLVSMSAIDPAVRNSAVTTVELVFSREMDPSSIDFADLQLTRDGSELTLFSNTLAVTPSADHKSFTITGLGAYTQSEGVYVLTARAANTQDSAGNAGVGALKRRWTMDTTGVTPIAVETLATNPRNIVVMSLDVDFSEAIDTASFDRSDITLTRDGGANLIDDRVQVIQVDENTWRITGFNWVTGIAGGYTLTLNGAAIKDLAGNDGNGSASTSWAMDITDPLAPTELVLAPDNGISGTDRLTNTRTLTLTGNLPEDGLSVRLTDTTTNQELGYATVSGSSFSHAFTLSGAGTRQIRVRVADAAGNLAPDAFITVVIDETAPGVSSVGGVSPSPRTTPVSSLAFSFDEAVATATVTLDDVSLTRDGQAVAFDAAVTLTRVDAKTYRLDGLDGLTAATGTYVLTVSAAAVNDLAGNAGAGEKRSSWVTLASLPTGISGKAYEDLDGSGTYNPIYYNPESLLAGRKVFIDTNLNGAWDDGEAWSTTASDGSYAFTDLAAGTYRVVQELPSGWILNGPGPFTLTLAEGGKITGADFGNFKTATIDGVVFDDLNANGSRDAGENPLANWKVFLDANANGVLDGTETSVLTDGSGAFSFSGIGPSTVAVAQMAPTGWLRTSPAVPYYIKSGFSITADLGNVQPGSISGMKFNDLDGNGARDAAEQGVAGWTIFLDTNTNGALDAGERWALTDAQGRYSFDSLLPGSYVVAEVQREGWIQTKPLPTAVSVGLTTAASDILMEVDCSCGSQWATLASGPVAIDYGKIAIETALDSVGISALRASGQYGALDGLGTTTVVIDTGIDLDHSFFGGDLDGDGVADRIVYAYDFAGGDADASDMNGHGSHIASLIGGADARYGGVAPGTDIIALKVFDDSGRGTFAHLEKALQWAYENRTAYGISVVNLSLGDGGNWTNDLNRYGIGDELAALSESGVIVVAAAGNSYLQFGRMGVAYPASDPAAIAVGATWAADFGGPWTVSTGATNYATGIDQITAFSQRDTALLDTFAPGARFNGAYLDGGIRTMQGTSQAAAFVSGAAALAQQIAVQTLGRTLTTGEFATLLRTTGHAIVDGDDEIDNVANTGETFGRMDFAALASLIATLDDAPAEGGSGGNGSGSGQQPVTQLAAGGVHNVTLAAGTHEAGLEFGNFELGTISGLVFDDSNGNRALDSGEAGRAGVTVYVDADDDNVFDADEVHAVTATDGSYLLTAMPPGLAVIRLALPADQVSPPSATVHVTSGLQARNVDFALAAATVNTPPKAMGDSYTLHGTTLNVNATAGLLANDSDADGDDFTTVSHLYAGSGTLQVHDDGSFSYAPAAGFTGTDSFTYTIRDEMGAEDSAMVTIAVVNNPPKAVEDSYTLHGTTLNVNATTGLLANDSDADGDGVIAVSYSYGGSGVLDVLTDGSFSYTPAAGFAGTDSFTYTVRDEMGAEDTATVTIEVVAATMSVTAFAQTEWGFEFRFSGAIDQSTFNAWGSDPDITVVGDTVGGLRGSVIFDDDGMGLKWVRTGAGLSADTYRIRLRGTTDGVRSSMLGALDGDGNGTAGGDYAVSAIVTAPPSVRLRLPDFARGPGQDIKVPNTGVGLPISLVGDGSAHKIEFTIRTDPGLFVLGETPVQRGSALPAGASLSWQVLGNGAVRIVIDNGASALPAGQLAALVGSVPGTASLKDAGMVMVDDIVVDGVASARAGDAAVQLVAYSGDMDFSASYTAADATRIQRLVVRLDSYAPEVDDIDAIALADVDGDGMVNSIDAARVLQRTRLAATPTIPAIPDVNTLASLSATGASKLSAASSTASTTPVKAAVLGLPATRTAADASAGATTLDLAGSLQNFSLPAANTSISPSVSPLAALRIVPSAVSQGALAH